MRSMSPGRATDLAILELTGSSIEDHGDHLVVRSPSNPLYHWGNCVVVRDDADVEDAVRWVGAFGAAFPTAGWVAIGLPRMPQDVEPWVALGIAPHPDEELTTRVVPRAAPRPDGYDVRQLRTDGEWDDVVARGVRENATSGEEEPVGYEQFLRAQATVRRTLADRGDAAWFGAYADGLLVADLGIVRCGTIARYQAVGTDEEHRGRGLASHLLGVAALWSQQQGCREWVIVTETVNPAGRVYRRAGFAPGAVSAEAYRPPPR